jgi:hypothetical protein
VPAEDSTEATADITVTPVNDDPTANDDTPTVLEDSSNTTINVKANDTFAPDTGEVLTVTAVGSAANGTTSLVSGSVRYTPDPNYFGADSFSYTVSDGNGGSASADVDVTVTGVNDQPDFTAGANQTVAEDSGLHTVAGWATGITKGAGNEGGQTLTFTATPVNAALFAAGPAISASGTLTFTPAADAFGSTTVDVILEDDGAPPMAATTPAPRARSRSPSPRSTTTPDRGGRHLTVAEDAGFTTINVRPTTGGAGHG